MRIRLTAAVVNALEPEPKEYAVTDAGQPGLRLTVWPGGTKAFSVLVRRGGRILKRKLGVWPELSVTAARERAAEMLSDAAESRGLVPIRFDELFRKRLESVKCRKRTWAEDERKFSKHLTHWASRQVASIKPDEVRRLHNELATRHGEPSANRVLSLVKAVFAYGAADGRYLATNPAAGVSKFREAARERFLSTAELPRFLKALKKEPRDYHDLFTLLLFTGARAGNACSMRWDEIDLHNAVWTIPAAKSKNKRTLFVPLVGPALEILDLRHDLFGDCSPWVFPVPHNVSGHVTELRRAWERICKRADLVDLRIHDLRHSLASWQAMSGASLPIIGKALGHADQRSTERYSHLQLDVVRASVSAAVAAMKEAK